MRRHFGKRHSSHGSIASFVDKLSKILETPQYADIIAWTPNQDAFSIKSVNKLTETVLPVFFKHRNFSSFIRQLNMYNFNKVRGAEDQQVYMNEHFRRNFRNDYRNIKRRTVEDREEVIVYEPKRTGQLAKELAEMTRKQKELEIVIKHLVADNQNLRTENTKLWKRIQKNIDKSDKKVEKLMLFMLFGNQSMGEMPEQMMIEQNGSESKLKLEEQQSQMTPKQAFRSNLIEMIRNQCQSQETKQLLDTYKSKHKSSKKKQFSLQYDQQEIKNDGVDQTNLSLKQNGQQFQPPQNIIDDVNMFLNVEGLPSDH